jgi:hypothetical protein
MLKFAEALSNIRNEKVEIHLLSNTARKPIFSAWGFFEVNIAHYFMVETKLTIEFFISNGIYFNLKTFTSTVNLLIILVQFKQTELSQE